MFLAYYFKHNVCLLSLNVTQKRRRGKKIENLWDCYKGLPHYSPIVQRYQIYEESFKIKPSTVLSQMI